MTVRGRPKLTDFGLAKLHAFMQPGVTLAEFASRPFTPPDPDEGVHSFGRDLFSFAALAVSCLSQEPIKEYHQLYDSLESVVVPDPIRSVLRRCLSKAANERPLHAGVLAAELDAYERQSTQARIAKRTLYMTVWGGKAEAMRRELGVDTDQDMMRRLQEELSGPCGVEPFAPQARGANVDERHYRLYGSTLQLHAKVEAAGDRLLLFSAWNLRPSECERSRERACPIPFMVRLRKPAEPAEGAETILDLARLVDEHQAEAREKEAERQEQRLLDSWANLLRARSQFETERNPPIHYDGAAVDGNRIRLSVAVPVPDELLGTQWKLPVPNAVAIRGEIEDISEGAIVIQSYGSVDNVPRKGTLRFDAWAAEQAIERQKLALEAVRLDRAVKGNLRRILLKPTECRVPTPLDNLVFANPRMDEAKQLAVRLALGSEDLLLVEGPPGTGKTTFIAELVYQFLKQHPEQRVLLASQTHVALDNAIERLRNLNPELKLVRVAGRFSGARVSESVRDTLLDVQMDRWRREALEAGQTFITAWATEHGVSRKDVDTGVLLVELRSLVEARVTLRQQRATLEEGQPDRASTDDDAPPAVDELLRDDVEEDIRRLKREDEQIGKQIRELEKRLKKLDSDLASEFVQLSAAQLDHEIETYLPATGPVSMARKLVDIHADWAVRFGRTPEFGAALLMASQVVAGTCVGIMGVRGSENVDYDLCIIDEASKATPTETLVPLSRARRCVIVGDSRQLSPFQEPAFKAAALAGRFALTEDDLKTSLFDHLVDQVPEQCRVALTMQHRMVAPIGDLISECFYEGRLQSVRPAARHALDGALPKRVLWLSTSRLARRREQTGVSVSNPAEVREVVALLKRVGFLAAKDAAHSVAILSGYSSQRRDLERAVQADQSTWSAVLRTEVNTVDAFQGREADVAIYSVTRSNEEGNIGFLFEQPRINVALSRAREFLVIVGDHAFCRRAKGENPLKLVLDYIETHPDTCQLTEVTA